MVKSAKAVMADRSLALSTLQSARSDVDGKRTKLAKLRGTPGIKVLPIELQPMTNTKTDVQHRTALRSNDAEFTLLFASSFTCSVCGDKHGGASTWLALPLKEAGHCLDNCVQPAYSWYLLVNCM